VTAQPGHDALRFSGPVSITELERKA